MYIQEPTLVLLGSDWEWVVEHGEQKLTKVKHYGYTIELQEGLQVYIPCQHMYVCVCVCIVKNVYNIILHAGTAKQSKCQARSLLFTPQHRWSIARLL